MKYTNNYKINTIIDVAREQQTGSRSSGSVTLRHRREDGVCDRELEPAWGGVLQVCLSFALCFPKRKSADQPGPRLVSLFLDDDIAFSVLLNTV